MVRAQRGLKQLGDSRFYMTPDEPADPTDCNRYPDSPFCGGFPFSPKLLGFEIRIVSDECNKGVQVNGDLAFIKLPPHQLVFRPDNPTCSPPTAPNIPPIPTQSPDLPAPPLGSTPYPESIECADPNAFVIWMTTESYTKLFGSSNNYGTYETFFEYRACYLTQVTFPVMREDGKKAAVVKIRIPKHIYKGSFNSETREYDFTQDKDHGEITYTIVPGEEDLPYVVLQDRIVYDSGQSNGYMYSLAVPGMSGYIAYCWIGDRAIELYRMGNRLVKYWSSSDYYGYPLSVHVVNPITGDFRWTRHFRRCFPYESKIQPPPPRPPKKKDMDCCEDLRGLLALILKRIGTLPATVPLSLITVDGGTKTINSLAEYLAYSVIQTNAQFGQFPQEIQIDDTDLTQEGNQSKKIKLPNLAESIAEIMGALLVLQSESNANLIATVNAMIEAGSAKQAAILAGDYAAANAEFLGYKGKQTEKKVAFTFKPGEPRLDKMLKPGEVKLKGWENDDKYDLNDVLVPLLEMAAFYRAQNFRNLGTSDTLTKLRDVLKGAANLSTAIDHLVDNPSPSTDPNAPIPEPKKNEWDTFVEQAETGFIAQPGITDNVNPYNRPLTQRPQIREIGIDTTENNPEPQ